MRPMRDRDDAATPEDSTRRPEPTAPSRSLPRGSSPRTTSFGDEPVVARARPRRTAPQTGALPGSATSPASVVGLADDDVDDLDQLAPARQRARTPYPDDELFATATGGDPVDDGFDGAVSARLRGFLEWGAVIVGALAVALLIKTFLMQAYYIPSPSMEPTLEVGDRLLVNKLSYSFGDMSRGDLVVFHRPPNASSGEDDLIKRIIALPGETIEVRDGEILITLVGETEPQRLNEPYLPDGLTTRATFTQRALDQCAASTATSCTVPDGYVFVMGDNRGNSSDSRAFGPIDEDLVVGRAFLRVWPLSEISFL